MTYLGLQKIFIGEGEDTLPIFIVFRDEFIPTIDAINFYATYAQDHLIGWFEKASIDTKAIWEAKDKVLK